MMTTATRILTRRKSLKLSQRVLGKTLGVSHATISLWETDMTKPNGQNLLHLARALKTTTEWLAYGAGSEESEEGSDNPLSKPIELLAKRLPIISSSIASKWSKNLAIKEIEKDIDYEEAPSTSSNNSFWMRVDGDSMTATAGLSIQEGMLILVDPEIEPSNGKLVIAKLHGSEETTFKKLMIDAGMKFLKPLNQSYPTLTIDENCKIIGVVTEAKLKF